MKHLLLAVFLFLGIAQAANAHVSVRPVLEDKHDYLWWDDHHKWDHWKHRANFGHHHKDWDIQGRYDWSRH